MADSFVQLPYTATTSGDILDASSLVVGANTVKRERMVIGNDTSSHVAIVSSSGALSVSRAPTSLSSGTITFSSAPTINISSGIISVTSGLILSSNTLTGIIGTSGGQAVVTTSGGLEVSIISGGGSGSTVVSLSSAIAISSGLITLSSPTSLSSGLVTLTGTNVVTNASSGFVQVYQTTSPWSIAGTIVSASSGLVQVLQSTGVWAVSGTVTVGNPSTGVNIVGSSNAITPATSSGGLLVTFTNSVAGSTSINLVGSSNAITPATSSGGLLVTFTNSVSGSTNTMISGSTGTIAVISSAGAQITSIVSSGGIYAPVTSSFGLQVNYASTNMLLGLVITTLGFPVSKLLTTAAIRVFTVVLSATGTAGNVIGLHTATSALSTNTGLITLATFIGSVTMSFSPRGLDFPTGLTVTDALTFGSTLANTSPAYVNVEYSL